LVTKGFFPLLGTDLERFLGLVLLGGVVDQDIQPPSWRRVIVDGPVGRTPHPPHVAAMLRAPAPPF
jgi:hypothetical protein